MPRHRLSEKLRKAFAKNKGEEKMGSPQGDPPDLRDTGQSNLDQPPPPISVSIAPPTVPSTTVGSTIFSPTRVAAGGTLGQPLRPDDLLRGTSGLNPETRGTLPPPLGAGNSSVVPSGRTSVESAPPPLLDLTEPEQLRGVVGHSPDASKGASKSTGTSAQPKASSLKAPKGNPTGAKKKANPLKEKQVNPPKTTW